MNPEIIEQAVLPYLEKLAVKLGEQAAAGFALEMGHAVGNAVLDEIEKKYHWRPHL